MKWGISVETLIIVSKSKVKNVPEKNSCCPVLKITLTLLVFPPESSYDNRIFSSEFCFVVMDNVSYTNGVFKEIGVFEGDAALGFVPQSKRFWIVSIGLKFEAALEIIFLEESLTLSILFVIESVVLSAILSTDSSILFSTDSDAFEPIFNTSSLIESITAEEVVGKKVSISLENTMAPKIMMPAIMPNFMSILDSQKKWILDWN